MLAQSPTLCLRRFSPDDCDAFQAYRRDPDVAKYQSWEPMSDERARGFLAYCEQVSPLLQPGEWTQIAIADPTGQTLMGDMGVFLSKDSSEVELGITLARMFHRQGHATNAMRLAMGFVFDTTDANRIICGADQRNAASLGLIRKLGFHFTHSEPDKDAGIVDDMFAITRAEFAPT